MEGLSCLNNGPLQYLANIDALRGGLDVRYQDIVYVRTVTSRKGFRMLRVAYAYGRGGPPMPQHPNAKFTRGGDARRSSRGTVKILRAFRQLRKPAIRYGYSSSSVTSR